MKRLEALKTAFGKHGRPNPDAGPHALCEPPCQLRCQRRPCDFTIECSDGSIRAHRNVLADASDYFRGLFAGHMMEAESCRVQFRDMTLATVTKIVDFIYKGTANVTFENALDLLIPARYLFVNKLMALCSEILRANLTLRNAIEMYNTASDYCITDLQQFAFDELTTNVVALLSKDRFLLKIDHRLMRTLLESDSLVVPHEDWVFEALRSWVNKDRAGRMRYVDEFKELVRFPFLKVDTVTRLEETLGPIKGLAELRTDGWNLERPIFRRRKYTMLHCHFVWKEHRKLVGGRHAIRLILTCNILGQSQRVLMYGNPMCASDVFQLEISGHRMYSLSSTAIFSYSARRQAEFTPAEEKYVRDIVSAKFDGILLLHAGADGVLRVITHSVDGWTRASIFTLNTSTSRFEEQGQLNLKPSATSRWSNQRVLLGNSGYLLDPSTGNLQELTQLPKVKGNQLRPWIEGVQRDDTFFLWYDSGLRNTLDMTSLSLSNNTWGTPINTDWRNLRLSYTDIRRVEIMHGEIYMLHRMTADDFDQVEISRYDEERGTSQKVHVMSYLGGKFEGRAPVDLCESCRMDTWLSVEIRKLPDETPNQRMFINRLRELAR